ncbi:MAG: anthranilate synthase component I family protein [Thermaerobacterales bacterium]
MAPHVFAYPIALERPVTADELSAMFAPDRCPVILNSALPGAARGWGVASPDGAVSPAGGRTPTAAGTAAERPPRWCMIAADPFALLTVRGRRVQIDEPIDGIPTHTTRIMTGDPFDILQQLLAERQVGPAVAASAGTLNSDLPDLPFFGGAMGFFGYELNRWIEPHARIYVEGDADPVSDLSVGLYESVLLFNLNTNEVWVAGVEFDDRPGTARRLARQYEETLRSLARRRPAIPFSLLPVSRLCSNFNRSEYMAAVGRARAYIHAGDIYQVNLAQRLRAELGPLPAAGTPIGTTDGLTSGAAGRELYRRLQRNSPAPFSAFLAGAGWALAGASPERFLFSRGDGWVETCPIKGTRGRSADPPADRALAGELMASGKDAAELVMIVDLERNDLGRVCRYGSVSVAEPRRLESFPDVHHTTAVVRGRLRSGVGAVDLLRAAFPGGSITGAPKIRAMEIIAELEQVRRGPYTGAVGYLGFDGRIDLNIAIRTATLRAGQIDFHVGGGIVAESDPAAEYEETLTKAGGILSCLDSVAHAEVPKCMSG